MKEKFTIEYAINTLPKILYDRISTTWGLSEWFADDVNQKGNLFTFSWDSSEQEAELISHKELQGVQFRWIDDEEEDESYFEIVIQVDELTRDVTLVITDFAEKDEIEDAISLWDAQIEKLRNALGT